MSPNDADWMANSVDPDQTALGAVWSGSALFTQAYQSENLGSLLYMYLENFANFWMFSKEFFKLFQYANSLKLQTITELGSI